MVREDVGVSINIHWFTHVLVALITLKRIECVVLCESHVRHSTVLCRYTAQKIDSFPIRTLTEVKEIQQVFDGSDTMSDTTLYMCKCRIIMDRCVLQALYNLE